MKMNEYYVGLEKELQKNEEFLAKMNEEIDLYLAKAAEAEAEMKKWQAKAEEVEANGERTRQNVLHMRNMLNEFSQCDFAPSEEELEKEKQEAAKKEMLSNVKVKPVKSWVKHKGEIGQYKPDGTIINSYTSQKSAAIGLRWDQSSVCKFMKLDRQTQIRKKGFYLEYMG